ncbi:ABC transporter permease [Streptomyces sp. NPDC018031]|uniref:ABC transporter permease n=1 Tax=Streptomyces sp. NPDC018031 TaxID=3365033 RepID=UPI0037B79EA0
MSTLARSAAEPRARFRDLLAAEWIKLWSLRSTPWACVITALAVVGFNAGTAYDTYRYWPADDPRHRAGFVRDGIALTHAFTANAALVLMLAAAAIGAAAVVGEYSSGLIRTTFAAVPARRSVMAAKVAVVTAVTTVLGAVIAVASFVVTQAILSGRGAGVPMSHPGAWRVLVASALLAPVCALTGMAIGTLARHMGITLVGAVALLLLLPLVFTDDRYWAAVVDHALPAGAWDRLVAVGYTPAAERWPSTVAGAWTVDAVWLLAAAALTVAGVHRRDQ